MILIGDCVMSTVIHEIWNIFSIFNGNPDTLNYNSNYGIRFTIGMFFSMFLFIVIKMRAMITMKRQHVVAMIGALLLFIRYLSMLGLEWGYQIGLYNDPLVHFLYPPLEHFFYMIGITCFAYYSLFHYKYYPGMLRKMVYGVPVVISAFFIYATIQWKHFFIFNIDYIIKYKECAVDWQSHLILTTISFYLICVAIFKYGKNNHWLSAFWTVTFIEHLARTICFYNNFEPSWLATVFHAAQIWAIPLLTLHFIKAYVVKLGFCELCKRDVEVHK